MRICFEHSTCNDCVKAKDELPIVIINTSVVSIDKFDFFMNEFNLKPFLQGATKEKNLFEYLRNTYLGIIASRKISLRLDFLTFIDKNKEICLCNQESNTAFAHMYLSSASVYVALERVQKEVCFGIICGSEKFAYDGNFFYLVSGDISTRIYCN